MFYKNSIHVLFILRKDARYINQTIKYVIRWTCYRKYVKMQSQVVLKRREWSKTFVNKS